MNQLLLRGVAFGVLAGGLAACASDPTYPVVSVAPPPAAPTAQPAPPVAPPQPPPQGVDSQPLAAVRPQARPGLVEDQPRVAPMAAEPMRPREEPARFGATGKVIDARNMYRSYQVQKGDHLDAIARDLDSTRSILIEANHLKDSDSLRPGQRLKVPIEKAYVAQSGDTLALVARRFDISLADLADLNALSERHRLRGGEQLALPGTIHDKGPVPLPPTRMAARFGGYRSGAWTANPGPLAVHPPAPYPSDTPPAVATLTDAQVTAAGRGRFVWPVIGDILSTFGVKDIGRRNDGVDVKAPQGASVRAAAAGDVVYAGDQVPGFGNLVLVKHADGWVTAYAHLDRVSVKMRESVAQNQEIGQVGQSGGAAEPELHFEVRYAPTPMDRARPIDPLLVLPSKAAGDAG